MEWRAAHAWLSGYSDALAERKNDPGPNWSGTYADDYARGYRVGLSKLTTVSVPFFVENFLDTSMDDIAGVQEAIEAGDLPELP